MSATYDVAIVRCDPLNLGVGYSVRVTASDTGEDVLFVDRDPVTGDDLLTLRDALRVAYHYAGADSGTGLGPSLPSYPYCSEGSYD